MCLLRHFIPRCIIDNYVVYYQETSIVKLLFFIYLLDTEKEQMHGALLLGNNSVD